MLFAILAAKEALRLHAFGLVARLSTAHVTRRERTTRGLVSQSWLLEPRLPFACLLSGVQAKVFRCRNETHSGLPCVRGRRALSTSSVLGVSQAGPDPAVAASPLPAPSSSGCVNPMACRIHSRERWDEWRPSRAYFFWDEYAWFDGAR